MDITNFNSPHLIIIFLISSYLGIAPPTLKAAGKPSPSTRENIQQSNRSFKKCRSDALTLMKDGKLSPKRLKRRLVGCKEKFPGASLYISCKKKALKTFKGKKSKLKEKILECKQLLVGTTFEPDKPIPFMLHKSQYFFAGIGFNKPLSLRELKLPNFDCSKVRPAVKKPQNAEFFLFGNHPQMFKAFSRANPKKISRKLGLPRSIPPDGHYVDNLGKVFGDIRTKKATIFFPSASCVFSGQLGPNFTGLSVYYLVDSSRQLLLPYFSIAFYHPNFSALSKGQMGQELEKMFAENGEKEHKLSSISEQIDVVASAEIKEFDEEGDPRNLCAQPRSHRFISVLKGRENEKNKIEYVIMANIKNLCSFGDKVTRPFR